MAYSQLRMGMKFFVKADTLSINKYKQEKPPEKANKQLVLKMNYGEPSIINAKEAEILQGANIVSVDLVYTAFPNDFDMEELNLKRLSELYFVCPDIFNQPLAKWRFVKQTDATSASKASTMLHAFVITYHKVPTHNLSDLPLRYKKLAKGEIALRDSSLLRVFSRNNSWKKDMIVCDFTGSMSPYYEQLLVWFCLNNSKTEKRNLIFFNDGDETPDKLKKIGKTGGVYSISTNNIDTLIDVAIKTIKGGYGGDSPENDIEALLMAEKNFPDSKEIILIADNWSSMRDYSLIKQLKKPVRVILCGTSDAVNIQYLDLAKSTGGSIHTMNDDLTELIKLKEGEVITIGNEQFKIVGGNFVKVFKT